MNRAVLWAILPTFIFAFSCGKTAAGPTPSSNYTFEITSPAPVGDKIEISAPGTGKSITFQISSNTNWKVYVMNDSKDWISSSVELGKNDGEFRLTIDPNTVEAPRSGKVIISAPSINKSYNVVVNQEGGTYSPAFTKAQPQDLMLLYLGGSNNGTSYPAPTVERHMKCLLSNPDKDGVRDWLYDGYLYLCLTYNGRSMAKGYGPQDTKPSVKADWLAYIRYIVNTCMKTMDSAVAEAVKIKGSRPRKIKVVVMIPNPQSGQGDWGELEGKNMNFNNEADRISAVKWYIDEFYKAFSAANFKNIECSGYYWFDENFGMSAESLKVISNYIHSVGTGFYWIPYFAASHYAEWKAAGFDYAYLQPNYYFHDNLPEDRCETACQKSQIAGINNMEIEYEGSCLKCKNSNFQFYHDKVMKYIEAFDKYGMWTKHTLAYYYSSPWESMSSSTCPEDIELYNAFRTRIAERQKKFYGIQ